MRNVDDEAVRLQTLRGYEILDTPREARFDDICLAVKKALNLPYVELGFFDESRLWFKSTIGLHMNELPRGASISSELLIPGVTQVVIPDTRLDPRSRDSFLVTSDYQVWSYAGVPLVAPNGRILGSLACQDVVARDFTAQELAILQAFAKQIMELMETQRAARELESAQPGTDAADSFAVDANGQAFKTALRAAVSELIFESLNNFGWWAAQAWWYSEYDLTPSEWSITENTPKDLLALADRDVMLSPAKKSVGRFPQPTLQEIAKADWLPNAKELAGLGAKYLVVLDLYSNIDAAIRLLFIVPDPESLTVEAKRFLGLSAMLLPKVIVREKAREELQFRATHDALTGLLNRRGLASKVAAQNELKSRSRAILFMDIDKFKGVNDNYGHNIGDELLIYIASVLRNAVRTNDTVARMGGDEFVIVTADTPTYVDLKAMAERLFEHLAKPHTLSNGLVWAAEMSIGAALWEPQAAYEVVLGAADHLMYQAKKNGGGFNIEPIGTSHTAIPFADSSLQDSTVLFNAIYNPRSKDVHAVIAQIHNDFRVPEARQTAHILAAEINKLDFEFDQVVLRLSRAYWFATEIVVDLISTLRKLLADKDIALLVGEEGLGEELLEAASFVKAATKASVYLASFGSGQGELAWVQKLDPKAIILDFSLIKTLEGSAPALRALHAALAISEALKMPSIAPLNASPGTLTKLSTLGCDLTISSYISKAGDLE